MKTYGLADTDIEFSRLGYGCMQIGGSREPIDRDSVDAATRIVAKAIDQGITLFDHADIYCMGRSESVFGEVMQQIPGIRDQIVIQSKCGIRLENDPQPGDPQRYEFSRDHIVRSVEASLRRLDTDRLDILLLHRPDPLAEPEQIARAFDELASAGKVRYFGVSNHNAGQIALLQKHLDQRLVINQLEISLLHNGLIAEGIRSNIVSADYPAAAGTLDYCRERDILVQAWSPLAGGALVRVPEDASPRIRACAREVAALAEREGLPPEAIALAWLLRHPAGIQPIVGTTREDRLDACCAADGVDLSREDWYRLFAAARGGPVP